MRAAQSASELPARRVWEFIQRPHLSPVDCPAGLSADHDALSRLHPLNGSGYEHQEERTFPGRGGAEGTVCSLSSIGAPVCALPSGLWPQAAPGSTRMAPPWTALWRSLQSRPAGPAGPGKLDAGPRGPGQEKLLAERSAASPQTRLGTCGHKTGPAAGSSRPAHRQVGSMPVIGCCSCQARCQGLVPGPHHLEHILYI